LSGGASIAFTAKEPYLRDVFTAMVPKFFAVCLLSLYLQLTVNWVILLYAGENWSDVWGLDYETRNSECYFQTMIPDEIQKWF